MLGPDVEQIPGNASRRVIFDLPGVSILNNHYLLPIGRYPLELVLEMIKDPRDVLAGGFLKPDLTVERRQSRPTSRLKKSRSKPTRSCSIRPLPTTSRRLWWAASRCRCTCARGT
jgi:hypothetical protein